MRENGRETIKGEDQPAPTRSPGWPMGRHRKPNPGCEGCSIANDLAEGCASGAQQQAPRDGAGGLTDREPHRDTELRDMSRKEKKNYKKPTRHNPTEERERTGIWGDCSSVRSPSWRETVRRACTLSAGGAGFCASCRLLHQPCG